MKLRSKKLFLILVVVNTIAIIGVVFLLILITTKNQKSLVLEKQLKEEEVKLEDLQMLKVLVANTKEQRSYISNLIVNKDKIIDFLGLVESLGSYSGAKVSVMSVNEDSSSTSNSLVKIRLNVSGRWEQVFQTISMLDHLPAAFAVKEIQISKETSTEGAGGKSVPARTFWSANIGAEVVKF